ncbi:unnamed protein product [Prorocentrum cordatum]|uniref:Uncharacterized protein n=1 Tax=Prorocentrum cordatum TaxID=2364126 RepID=A0ABN9TL10_9DINO|nr:unnamed protein product [Polarella glacialis]
MLADQSRPACVATVGFDGQHAAAKAVGGGDPELPGRAALAAPRGEDVPWPVRLARAAGPEEDATSSADEPVFQRKSKCQRRRQQRNLAMKAMARTTTTSGDELRESSSAPSAGSGAEPSATGLRSSSVAELCQ